jgi:Leucine-rich repeat (LRR) protein
MDDNKIQYLPKEIKNLKKLMFLDLSKNKFKNLPNEIGDCTALSDLYLSENEISELPETIAISKLLYFLILKNSFLLFLGCLSFLKILNLDVNQIRRIPNSIGG